MIKFVPDAPPKFQDRTGNVLSEWAIRQFRRVSDMWDAPRWDDLRAPAANLKGGATQPTWNNTYGLWYFAQNQDEEVFTQFQLPHAWVVGTSIYPHVHWHKTTSATGEVEWEFAYRWSKIGEVMDASWTTVAVLTPSVSDGDTLHQQAITPFGEVTTTGVGISDTLVCRLKRLGTSYSGSNHYGASAALIELDIHYLYDRGSRQEFIK